MSSWIAFRHKNDILDQIHEQFMNILNFKVIKYISKLRGKRTLELSQGIQKNLCKQCSMSNNFKKMNRKIR